MRNKKRLAYAVAGVALAAAMLWLLFRNVDLKLLTAELKRANAGWLCVSLGCFFCASLLRGFRWRPVLVQRAAVSWRAAYSTTQISQLANVALPLRGGPILRGLALTRLSSVPLSYAIGASFADRAVESVTLGAIILPLAAGLSFGGWVPPSSAVAPAVSSLMGLAALIFVLNGLFFWVVRKNAAGAIARRISQRLTQRSHAAWNEFSAGARCAIFSPSAVPVWGASLGAWIMSFLGHAAVLAAFGGGWPLATPVLTCILSIVTIVLPGAPGLIGPYHAAMVAALGVAQPESTAEARLAIALVMHAMQMGMLSLLGTIALLTEHQSLWALESAEVALESDKETTG